MTGSCLMERNIFKIKEEPLQPEEATTDDFLIAQMLQKQYDKEFDNALHKASTSVIYLNSPCLIATMVKWYTTTNDSIWKVMIYFL